MVIKIENYRKSKSTQVIYVNSNVPSIRCKDLFTPSASTSVYVRRRRVDRPMAGDVVARDMFVNIQFIKACRTKYWSKLLGEETSCMTLRPLTIGVSDG